MLGLRIKGKATLSWKHELVESADAGDFYIKVYPVLKNFREYKDKEDLKKIAREVIREAAMGKKNVKVKR